MCSPYMLNNHVLEGAHLHAHGVKNKSSSNPLSPSQDTEATSHNEKKVTFQQKKKSRKTICACSLFCISCLAYINR